MFYFEDHDLEEQSRAAGIEAFSANLGDKSAPHIIQRFVNIYDHLASTLFNKDMLQKLYPEQAGKKFSIQELTYAQRSFKNHVERYGYMNMAACPVPSVVGLKTSILDYSIALSNYTDFGIRVEKTLSTLYKLLAEIMNADDALKSLSTVSRLTTIDTQPKYRARYNAEMQKHIGESKPTTEVPYGKLVRSNKEMLQTFDHRNGFEKALDEKTKDQIENHVTKIAYLMNSVADQIANDDSETNGRVVSALSNTLFEVGQMTRDYGTYLFRINALIGVVDGVVAEGTNYTPAHVKQAVDEAVAAGNNGLEIAEFDAGLNAFNMGSVGKLLIGAIVAVIGVVSALVLRSKSGSGGSKGPVAAETANKLNEVMEQKPKQKAKEAIAKAPEVVKPAVVAVKSGATEVAKPTTSAPATASAAEEEAEAKLLKSNAAVKQLQKIERIWNHLHGVGEFDSGPKFDVESWSRNPIMPYEVRSRRMDINMANCLWYAEDTAKVKELEKHYVDLGKKFAEEVAAYEVSYNSFVKDVASGKLESTYASQYMLNDAEGVVDKLRSEVKSHYSTSDFDENDPIIKARLSKYSHDDTGRVDGKSIEEYMNAAYEARKVSNAHVDAAQDKLNKIRDVANKALREIENASRDDARKASELAPHLRDLRKVGLKLADMASGLSFYYIATTNVEGVVISILGQYHDFGKAVLALGEVVEGKG